MGKPVPQAERMSGAGPGTFSLPTESTDIQTANLLQVVGAVEQGHARCDNMHGRTGPGGLVWTPRRSLLTRALQMPDESQEPRKLFSNPAFMLSPHARALRILSGVLGPLSRF